jgi:transcriptional regulator with XRE-family HTH domain
MAKRMGNDICARFGQAIRKRRMEMGLSQEALAERATLHRTYIADIERGRRNVSLRNVEKLAQALDLSLADLCASVRTDGRK